MRGRLSVIKVNGTEFIDEINKDVKINLARYYITSYISATRCKGYCTLMFLVKNAEGGLGAHYFKLKFNHVGIKDYYYYEELSKEALIQIIDKQDLYPLHIGDAKLILQDAYLQSCRYEKRLPGDPNKYMGLLRLRENDKCKRSILKLQENLQTFPRIINAYLLALKNLDLALMYDLATDSLQRVYGERECFIKKGRHALQDYTLLKSEIIKFQKKGKDSLIEVQLIATDAEDNLNKIDTEFKILEIDEGYLIADVHIKKMVVIEPKDHLNPLNYVVYTKVYQINEPALIKKIFEQDAHIHITGELEDQICYKWFKSVDNLEVGIDVLEHIYGEFILTKQELIIYSHNLRNLSEICFYLKDNLPKESLSFSNKAKCDVRSIYQLLLDNKKFSEDEKIKSQKSYIISEAYFAKWHIYCLQNCCKSYFDKNMTTFNLKHGDNLIEIILYKKNGIINLFDNDLEKTSKELNFPQDKLYDIKELTTNMNSSENWIHLKVIKELNQNKLTQVYKNISSIKELANQYNLVQ